MSQAIASDSAPGGNSSAIPICTPSATTRQRLTIFFGTQALFWMSCALKDWRFGWMTTAVGSGAGRELTLNQLTAFGRLGRRWWMR